MSVSLINYYIKTHITKPVARRGYELFEEDKFESFEFVDSGRGVEAIVLEEDELFNVIVTDFKNMNIRAECSCYYGQRSVCQHSAAVLYKLISEINPNHNLVAPSKPPEFRNSSKPLLLENFEKLTFQALKPYLSRDDMFFNRHYIKHVHLDEGGLTFTISDTYDHDFEFITRVYREDGKYFSYCSCDRVVKKTCEHERKAIGNMVESGRKVLRYFEKGKKDAIVQEISQRSQIPEKFASGDYIKVVLDEQLDLMVSFQGPLEGVLNENLMYGSNRFYDLFAGEMKFDKRNLENLFEEPSAKKTAIGFVFMPADYEIWDSLVQPISGNVNKAGNKLTSGIEEISIGDLATIKVNEKERDAMILCEQINGIFRSNVFRSDNYPELYQLRKTHELMRQVFSLLEGHPFIFTLTDFEDGIRKNNLKKVQLSDAQVSFEASLQVDEDFISLVPKYRLGEQTFDLDDNDFIRLSDFIYILNHHLHLVKNPTLTQAIEFVEARGVMKAFRKDAPNFISNIVLPFSERFNIEPEGLSDFDTGEIFLKPLTKQVFISELEGYILFTPVVVYNHKKEVEVMSGGNIIEHADEGIRVFKRDNDFEQDFLLFLRKLHPDFEYQEQESALGLALDQMLENNWFFDAFEAMKKEKIEVLGLKKLKSFNYSPHRATINTGIKSGQDWFDLELEVKFGDYIIPLTKLKKHILNRERYIRLGDGSVGMLPDEWIGKLEGYFRAGEIQKDKIQVSKLRFGIVDELFDNIDDAAILDELAEKKKRLESFNEIGKMRKPAAIKATLRDYQKEGLNWLNFLNEMGWGGILADDMGLGKTLQILSLLAANKTKRPKTSLVVVPTTLIFNWQNEINKFYPSLKVLFHYGIGRENDTKNFSKYNLIVTTYGLMVNDIEILSKVKFNYVILDESQAIKNPLSKRYKAACLLQGKNKLTLTGTPIENNTFDLFAQMSFVNPGLLGTQKSFKDYYSSPIDKDKDPGRAGELRKMIAPFVMRRTKEQVATELPPKTEDVLFCRMDSIQQAIYEEYRAKYRDQILNKIDKDGLGKTKMSILDGMLKLRQICNNPALIEGKEKLPDESVKLDELMRQINEKTGRHKIVVFSQFVKMLKMIEKELKHEGHDYEYFDGSSSQKKRRESVSRFQEDENCRIFLISLKAGGTGINLTAADYVYIFDPWWNPAVENQAIDRTYRIGQDKKVFAYRMICKDTIEEKIAKYQDQKRALAADIIRTDESFVKQLDKESIMDLFG